MNILVVNDDGYTSKGLKILKEAMKNYGNVTVVAPHVEQSAKSASITIRDGIKVHDHGDQVYSVEGTPSDCVKIGLYALNIPVDLVVSGINKGYNLGIDTIYSGTVGACMEALMNGVKAIAFSSDLDDFENAQRSIGGVLEFILMHNLTSSQYVLNVNFQSEAFKEPNGIVITNLGIRRFTLTYEIKDGVYYSNRKFLEYDYSQKTDLWANKNGYISITPLKLGNGDAKLVELLNNKVQQ